MDRKFWNFKAAADEPGVGELRIYGPIGTDDGLGWFLDEVTPKQFKKELDDLGAISEIRVFINSAGGDVFAGQAIYSMLRRHTASVTVYVDGLAGSIASVIVMAGDKVIMPRNAMMMIHNPWTLGLGDAEAFRKLAETLDQIRESLVAAYQDKTGMARDDLLSLLNAETWMTAAEAVELGFADEIEESKRIAASMEGPGRLVVNGMSLELGRYQNAPKPDALFGGVSRTSPSPITYVTQADSVLAAVSELETRTLERLTVRAKNGRGLTSPEIERWEHIRDTAEQVLSKASADLKKDDDGAIQVAIEYERIKSILHGMPV